MRDREDYPSRDAAAKRFFDERGLDFSHKDYCEYTNVLCYVAPGEDRPLAKWEKGGWMPVESWEEVRAWLYGDTKPEATP